MISLELIENPPTTTLRSHIILDFVTAEYETRLHCRFGQSPERIYQKKRHVENEELPLAVCWLFFVLVEVKKLFIFYTESSSFLTLPWSVRQIDHWKIVQLIYDKHCIEISFILFPFSINLYIFVKISLIL